MAQPSGSSFRRIRLNKLGPQNLDLESELREGELAFFEEFVVGGFDLRLGVVVELESVDDLPVPGWIDLDREGGDDPGRGIVFAFRNDADGMESVLSGSDEVADGVDYGVGGGGGRGGAAGFDDGFAALSNGGDEGFLEPGFVGNGFGSGLLADFGVVEIGEHGGAVVAPDAEFGDFGNGYSGLLGELGLGAVFVEPGHCEELLVGDVGCAGHCDEAVGVAGVAHYQDADAGFGVVVDGFALPDEDFAINAEEVGAFHALLAGTDPTRRAQSTSLKPSLRSAVCTISVRSGKAQSSSSIATPLRGARPGSISMRLRATGWSGPNIAPEAMRNRRA